MIERLRRGAARIPVRAAVELHGASHAVRAGMLRPESPRHTVASLSALRRYGQLGAAISVAAIRNPGGTAIVDELGSLTFGELDRRSNALANEWRKRGIGPGSTLALLCRNHRGFLDATFASAKLGGRAVYLNTDFAGPQIADVCKREGVSALIYDEEFSERVAGAEAEHGWFLAFHEGEAQGETLEDLIAAGDDASPPATDEGGSVVMLTSGTTGTPKGAPRAPAASMAAVGALFSKTPFKAGEATYIASPMFHALGFAHTLLAVGLGSTLVTARRFDPEQALASVAESGATALIVVPVMLQRMLALGSDAIKKHDLTALRIIFVSGSQLEADVARRGLEAFGPKLYNLYGSTEVAWATIATPEDLVAAPGCAGKPPFGTNVRLYDDQDRRIDQTGATGRIFVNNGFEFEGYTGGGGKQVIDGLMSTGDVGHFDAEGRLYIDGRDDEMIVSGGENVFPHEVEELLCDHGEIEEAAAIGVEDPDFGQSLRAFVVLRPGSELGVDDIRAYVKENLARYKVPREVVFIDRLPRNPTGKILKRKLAEAEAEEATR